MPQISIVVPVYNVEPYLNRCISSIICQEYADFDLILVDDGSTDNSPTICDEWAARDSRIIVFHQPNQGPSSARNTGIDWAYAHSSSQWITFIDSDDWIHPQYLSSLVSSATSSNVQLSMCESIHATAFLPFELHKNIDCRKVNSETAYVQYYGMSIIACAKLYHKSLFSEFRFPYGKLHEDAFTVYKIIFQAKNVAICETPLYFYYRNPCSIMNSPWTPKRMDEIEAHEDHLKYMKDFKYYSAYKKEQEVYLRVLARHIVSISRSDKDYQKYASNLRKKLKKNILRCKKQFEYPISGNEWIYEAAFPYGMRLFWLFTATYKKIVNSISK